MRRAILEKKRKSPRNVWSPKNMLPRPEPSKMRCPDSMSEVECLRSEKLSGEFSRQNRENKKKKRSFCPSFLSTSLFLYLYTFGLLWFVLLRRAWACDERSWCSKAIELASATERGKIPSRRRNWRPPDSRRDSSDWWDEGVWMNSLGRARLMEQ